MGEQRNEPITGTAAGVPFTALPPTVTVESPAPLVPSSGTLRLCARWS